MGERDRISTLQAFSAAYSGQGQWRGRQLFLAEVRGCLLGLELSAVMSEMGLAQGQNSGSAMTLPVVSHSPKCCLAVIGKEGEVHPHNLSLNKFLNGSFGHLRPPGRKRKNLCSMVSLGQNTKLLFTRVEGPATERNTSSGPSALLGMTFQHVSTTPRIPPVLMSPLTQRLPTVPVWSSGTHLQWEHHKGHADQDDHQELGWPDLGCHIAKAHSRESDDAEVEGGQQVQVPTGPLQVLDPTGPRDRRPGLQRWQGGAAAGGRLWQWGRGCSHGWEELNGKRQGCGVEWGCLSWLLWTGTQGLTPFSAPRGVKLYQSWGPCHLGLK